MKVQTALSLKMHSVKILKKSVKRSPSIAEVRECVFLFKIASLEFVRQSSLVEHALLLLQSNPYKMFAAYFQPPWPSRPKTKGSLLFYFLKLYNFGFKEFFVGSTGSELQHPWISKIRCEQGCQPKKSRKNHFSGSILKCF